MNEQTKEFSSTRWVVASPLMAMGMAALLKAGLLFANVVPFNADEAIVALMARHILQGERPLFFYGQAYLGCLDAWLIAGGFAIFEQQVWVIRLVQILLYLGTIWTTARLGEIISPRSGGVGGMAFGYSGGERNPVYNRDARGIWRGVVVGNLTLWLALKMVEGEWIVNTRSWLGFGLLVGFGLWVFGLTLVYSVPAGVFLLWHVWRHGVALPKPRRWGAVLSPLFWGGLGFLLGAIPYWIGAMQVGGDLVAAELQGSAIAGVEGGGWLAQMVST